MAIGETLKAWRRGEFAKGMDYLFIDQADVDAGRLADNRLEQLNRKAFDQGLWTDEQWAGISKRMADAQYDNQVAESSPWSGFKEGFEEGAANVQDTIKKGIAAPLNFTLARYRGRCGRSALCSSPTNSACSTKCSNDDRRNLNHQRRACAGRRPTSLDVEINP